MRLCASDRKGRRRTASDDSCTVKGHNNGYVYNSVYRHVPDQTDRGGDGDTEGISLWNERLI